MDQTKWRKIRLGLPSCSNFGEQSYVDKVVCYLVADGGWWVSRGARKLTQTQLLSRTMKIIIKNYEDNLSQV